MAAEPVATPGHEVVDFEQRITTVEREKRCMEQLPWRDRVALFYLNGREHPLCQPWGPRFFMSMY